MQERDRQTLLAVGTLLGRPLGPGHSLVLDPETVASLCAAFAIGAIRSACAGCEWDGLCTAVAGTGLAGTRLPAAPTR